MSINISKLFDNIQSIAEEKGITAQHVSELLKESIEKAYSKENPDVNVEARINLSKKTINLVEIKKVVEKSEDEIDDDIEINLSDVIKLKKDAKIGDDFEMDVSISNFERRMAMHILQIFQQKLNEITNLKIYEKWKDKENLVVYAEVEKNDNLRNAEVRLNDDFGVVNKSDQIPNERLNPGQKYYFLIKEVKQQSKSWPIILSRTSPLLIQHLMAANVPEIFDGIVKMELIARVPGYKTKIAVSCTDPNIDPVGTCVGRSGSRIMAVSNHVNKEKIDIFAYDSDPKQLIVNMCSPESIVGLEITDDPTENNPNNKIVTIVCQDEVVEKIIGKSGINVRLMSMLTGWSIDVISLKLAIEDQIEYEDVTNLSPSKYNAYVKRQTNNVNFNNGKSKFKPFSSSSSQGFNDFDYDIEEIDNWGSKVTEEDVENLLNSSSKVSKKKKKVDDDDEEVIFVSGNESTDEYEILEDSFSNIDVSKESKNKTTKKTKTILNDFSFDSIPSSKSDDNIENNDSIKTNQQKESQSIDEFFDSYEEPSTKKKTKKDSKQKSNKSQTNSQDKKDKKKINVLDEFDVSEDDFDDTNDNNIDLDNINIDDDYEE
ncbi:transcription termination factor NusA [Malacoplasma muris]|uniref:transcription termination factor NusA n=1 Tax=Malacoplasma muris TaxID=2119 RepID=UPI00398F53E6